MVKVLLQFFVGKINTELIKSVHLDRADMEKIIETTDYYTKYCLNWPVFICTWRFIDSIEKHHTVEDTQKENKGHK